MLKIICSLAHSGAYYQKTKNSGEFTVYISFPCVDVAVQFIEFVSCKQELFFASILFENAETSFMSFMVLQGCALAFNQCLSYRQHSD